MTEAKIQKLEETISHLVQDNAELSDTVAKQWKQIDLLEARLKRLEDRLSSVEAEIPEGIAANEKPPHY